MDITPAIPKGKQTVTGYGNGQFKVSGEVYPYSILVFPDRTVKWDIAGNSITLENLQVVLEEEGEIDLLILGSGKLKAILPPKILSALKEVGIAIETMDTGAAVRTFNVLQAEGRRVAAALMVV